MPLPPSYYKYLKMLQLGPFDRHQRGGWRFGTRKVADEVVERLIADGRAELQGERVVGVSA
jgi:hypothetical protein